jgi:histidinol dehydrogenase
MKLSYKEDSENLLAELNHFIPSAGADENVSSVVSKILSDIKSGGNEAVLAKTAEFDGVNLTASELKVCEEELNKAVRSLSIEEKTALEEAIANITYFHQQSLPKDWQGTNMHNGIVGERNYPIGRVGVYVPGGHVPLVSTVVMTVTLAKVAQVPEIVVVTPPGKDGKVAVQLLAALQLLGISEVYKIGGAQAIGALTYGTESINPVDKIFGPGNAFVNEAKRQVFGRVGIDLLPGPSEVMVIADKTANPEWVAAALLAQAEHGSGKEKIYLLFEEITMFKKIASEIEKQIVKLTHSSAIEFVLRQGFFAIFLNNRERISEVANYIAPEHLELQVSDDNCEFYLTNITTAGAFLVGHQTATSVGDFAAGPSHVLPTGRSSRFSSGLRIQDFMRRSSVIKYDFESSKNASAVVEAFSKMENLDGHGNAHLLRLGSFLTKEN